MSKSRALLCLLSSVVVLASASFGATSDRVVGGINGAPSVALAQSTHHLAQPQFDQGSVDPALQMGTITMMISPTLAQQQALKQLLAQQQDRKSPNYHKWLTPEQFADKFGASKNDVQQISAWLKAQGFKSVHPARGRNWISFTGTAAQVENAFATQIHRYNVQGEAHYANSTSPKVPAALANVVVGFRGLDDFRPRPRAHHARPEWYSASLLGSFVAPGDFATLYDVNALYSAGIDGTGQKIAVMGQTELYLADLNNFRSGFGLSTYSCTTDTNGLITACNDPHFVYLLDGTAGLSQNGDISEADLDIEWSGAVARGAQIIYVNSSDTFTSFYYAVDNVTAPVLSLSYGECEFFDRNIITSSGTGNDELELEQASSEGISFINSSGDTGAAECDSPNTVTSTNLATEGLAVSYPASSPEVTGIGGSGIVFADWDNPTYWGTANGTDGGSILNPPGYVPEQVWNDNYEFLQYCQLNTTSKFCSQGGSTAQPGWVPITTEAAAQADVGISSSGGGASNCASKTTGNVACAAGFPKPTWQNVTVAGAGSVRLSPDVSFLATPNFPGYVFCTPMSELSNSTDTTSSCANGITDAVDNNLSIIGGTSASAPAFAGVVALLNQYLGGSTAGLGNVNPMLYQLAVSSPTAFHQITTGDNNVSCQPNTPSNQPTTLQCPAGGVIGYSAGTKDAVTGFNLVAGLGSIDVNNLAVAWAATRTATSAVLTFSPPTPSQGSAVTLTANVTPSTATGNVTFKNGSTVLGTSALASGVAAFVTSALPVGDNSVTATYNGNSSLNTSTSPAVTVTVAPGFTLTPTATSFQVAQGSNVNATVAVAFASGFSGTIAFSCTDPASGSTCTSPTAINAAGQVTFAITTAAPTAKLEPPLGRGLRIFFAALLPGLLGLFLTAGSSKRSMRGVKLLGLIVVLGLSTMWMASCGGSSGSSTKSPGTPKGTYTMTVTGTSGSSINTTTFQLVVQ